MADENTPDPLDSLVVPEDLSSLTDDELSALTDEANERAELLATDEGIEGVPADAALALIENALAVGEALDAEQAKRDEAKAEQDAALAAARGRIAERLNPVEDEPVAEGDEDDTEPEGEPEPEPAPEAREPEPVVAAARRAPRRRSREQEPVSAPAAEGPQMFALKDLAGSIQAGDKIDFKAAAKLITDVYNRGVGVDGPRQSQPLLRVKINTPEDRVLGEDDVENWSKINAVVGPEALVASGGLCAPVEPYYDLQLLASEATPVIDSLPRFEAARGGIRFMAPPTLASVTTAVGVKTAANDALGGTNATKTCQTIPCPAQTQVLIQAIWHCLTFGNMGARAWPELVEQFTGLTMASHARTRETAALDALAAGSTAVTGAQYNGAINTLFEEILRATDALRSRHRMDPNARFRAWLPQWSLGLLVADLIRGQFDRFSKDKAGVVAYLRTLGIEPVFYLDGPTGGAQVFGSQSAGALLAYPTTMIWFLAPEGTWIRLDGGTLDFGIVRDSVLNATNDFQMFGEVFENFANIGVESYKITTTICANGVVSAPAAPSGC